MGTLLENIPKTFFYFFEYLSKIIKAINTIGLNPENIRMPKKDKPLTKKERDEKRKAKKAKQSKTQTS